MAVIRQALAFLGPFTLLVLFAAAFVRPPAGTGLATGADGCDRPVGVVLIERCLAADRTNVELLAELGAGYEAEGRSDKAEAAYRQALDLDPHDGDLHVRLGSLLLQRGLADAAREEGEAALRWQPGRAAAHDLVVQASRAWGPRERRDGAGR